MQKRDKITEIIKKYDAELNKLESLTLAKLEDELKKEFNASYQSVKDFINQAYNDNICQEICYKYAKKDDTNKFKNLIKDYELKNNIT